MSGQGYHGHPQGPGYADEGGYSQANPVYGGHQQQQPYDYPQQQQQPYAQQPYYEEGYDLGNYYGGGGFHAPTPGPGDESNGNNNGYGQSGSQYGYGHGQDVGAAGVPVGPSQYEGDNGQPPHHNIHWQQSAQPQDYAQQPQHHQYGSGNTPPNDYLGVPHNTGAPLQPVYTNDTFATSNNPFDTPGLNQSVGPGGAASRHDLPPGASFGPGGGFQRDPSTEHIPLLDQGGGHHAPSGPLPAGPGGFTDPNGAGAYNDWDEERHVRYGRIPQRIPRRLKTVKQGNYFETHTQTGIRI